MGAGVEMKVIRARHGLKQAELAEILGVGREYVSDIERGKAKGSIGVWLRLAHYAGIEGEELTKLLQTVFDEDLKKGAQA